MISRTLIGNGSPDELAECTGDSRVGLVEYVDIDASGDVARVRRLRMRMSCSGAKRKQQRPASDSNASPSRVERGVGK